ncbi:hypothetical protein PC128_g20584 [Phytophthora cactorum]|nr:hypothetical protein PC128_g20584 [Phytophthora cactorum]
MLVSASRTDFRIRAFALPSSPRTSKPTIPQNHSYHTEDNRLDRACRRLIVERVSSGSELEVFAGALLSCICRPEVTRSKRSTRSLNADSFFCHVAGDLGLLLDEQRLLEHKAFAIVCA